MTSTPRRRRRSSGASQQESRGLPPDAASIDAEVKKADADRAHQLIDEVHRTGGIELDLSDLNLSAVPDRVWTLDQLEILRLERNGLTSLSEEIGRLGRLRFLNLTMNSLIALPESIGQLAALNTLDLDFNRLEKLPDELGLLYQLETLKLWDNNLSHFPDTVRSLTRLVSLDLDENPIGKIPEWIGTLQHLVTLHLSGLGLSHLPDEIWGLTNLLTFGVNDNQFTCLSSGIRHLRDLQRLWIANNKLTDISLAICDLSNLEQLKINNNLIESVPFEINRLRNLTYLDISENCLTGLPLSLRELTALKELYLHANPKLRLPPEVLGPTNREVTPSVKYANPNDILAYFFGARSSEARPLNEAKLILVGFGAVGKTSLVNRLVHNRFDPREIKTDGIQTTDWKLQMPRDEALLHIWDFGGQEIMHATHQFFLTQRSLYLLVLAGRQGREDADAEYWLHLIASFGADSPVIIVQNRIREHKFTLNTSALRAKFPQIKEFVETDCDDRTGLDSLMTAIRKETDALPHLRDPFPAAWTAVKGRLAEMDEDYLSFERYRELCIEAGEQNTVAQESLAAVLHALGIALNYKDDPRLSDTHVLNPRWVTEGVYRILNHPLVAEQHGELRVTDLRDILDPARYPRQRHDFLLQVMRKFELCFPFEEEGQGRYLVPELLNKEQPYQVDEFDPTVCLNFAYQYPTLLPEGLVPRFIVRSHVLSTGAPRWRTGVFLMLEENQALVVADPVARRLSVRVSGPMEGRRRLLAVIRSDFDRIHSGYRFRPEELVPVPGHPQVTIPYGELLVYERSREASIKRVINGAIVSLSVRDLLAGVDITMTHPDTDATSRAKAPRRAFVSYSHKDERYRAELETHLKLLEREGLLDVWTDRRIALGEEWKGKIDTASEQAELIVLLISPDFMASDYCYDIEMQYALKRHETRSAVVVPVLVRETNWRIAPFAKLQAVPADSRWVAGAGLPKPARDHRWREVSERIEAVLRSRPDGRPN